MDGVEASIIRLDPDDLPDSWYRDPDDLNPNDLIFGAVKEDSLVGSVFVAGDRSVSVPELGREMSFTGMYVWRLYVHPTYRGQGIGTVLVAAAISNGAERYETELATALVAPDNLPSRRVFERVGFEPTGTHTGFEIFGYRFL